MDDVIKNPNRNQNITVSYPQPEYKRLGKTPIPVDNKQTNSVTEPLMSVDDPLNNNHIIDNNDFVNFQNPVVNNTEKKPKVISNNDYILMVSGKVVQTGSFKEIEEKVRSIVYGDDENFSSTKIETEDIIVLKKINIKIGVFLEE